METATYQLWLNADRTVLVRIWSTGQAELATRDASWETWGPPVALEQEEVHQ